jgi:recombination protein U
VIGQGIVTDSDTEKELQKWQQVRENPIDESKLRQQYQNRRNNAQGQHFEREILAGCRYYAQHNIAVIDKTPEPFRVQKKSRDGIFTGRFSTPAQPDFQGTLYGGRSIMFEAKRTSKDRITRNVLTDTQMEVLEKHNRLGALCGVCVNIQDDFFFIPWNVWRDMKEMYGRQYITAADVDEYRVKFDGAVHFLDRYLRQKGAIQDIDTDTEEGGLQSAT